METQARTCLQRIILAFVAVTSSFLVASALTHHAAERIDRVSDAIAYNAAPAIEHLAAVRTEVLGLQLLLSEHVRARAADLEGFRDAVEAAARRLDAEMRAYLDLPAFPGEQAAWAELRDGVRELHAETERVLGAADGGSPAAARAHLDERFLLLAKRLLDATGEMIDFNASVGTDLLYDAEQAHITLDVEPFARCDVACTPGVLTSMAANLVRNGIKYIGDGPERRIMVRVLPRGDRVLFEIEDTGPGVPLERMHAIFDPYVRLQASRPGLGHATVKRLAEGHGGAVGVRARPGAGSIFWFELPLAEQGASSELAEAGAGSRDLGTAESPARLAATAAVALAEPRRWRS